MVERSEIFLIMDDIQQLPTGFDSPLHKGRSLGDQSRRRRPARHSHPYHRCLFFGR